VYELEGIPIGRGLIDGRLQPGPGGQLGVRHWMDVGRDECGRSGNARVVLESPNANWGSRM
jgi:hypothetical protein